MDKQEITRIIIESLPPTEASWIDILSALLTPVIALIALYIAYHQHKINEQRLRHETYERRLKIYKTVQKHLSNIVRERKTTYQQCSEYYIEASEATFLFDNSVQKKIYEIHQKSIDMVYLHEQMHPPDGSPGLPDGKERCEISLKESTLLKWHIDQLESSKEFFAKKLGLKNT
ncbi:MAG: hypothetical protein GXO85_05590 [Chlorobi bacterium]|nr:hypothetical protein [Chlorobiota bacterium]